VHREPGETNPDSFIWKLRKTRQMQPG